jgi:hypothetical protein
MMQTAGSSETLVLYISTRIHCHVPEDIFIVTDIRTMYLSQQDFVRNETYIAPWSNIQMKIPRYREN